MQPSGSNTLPGPKDSEVSGFDRVECRSGKGQGRAGRKFRAEPYLTLNRGSVHTIAVASGSDTVFRSFESEVAWTHLVHQFENATAPPRYAGKWIICHDDGQARFFCQEFVDVAQESASTGQNDAMFGDVASQFGGRLFQGLLHDADDALEGLLQCFEDLVAAQGKPAWHALSQVPPRDGHLPHLSDQDKRIRFPV